MTLRASKALRNYLLEGGSLKQALSNCVIKLYTGAQPSSAEAAPTGTLLNTYSLSSGAVTREVRSAGSVDLTGGGSGSVDTITVNSIAILPAAVAFDTSLAQTAQNVADAINNNPKNALFVASVSSAKIVITAKPGMGTLPNGWTVASTTTTITKTDVNMGTEVAGVDAVNGLNWGDAADGTLIKLASETWSGVAAASGTAGWFRIEASVTDPGTLDSSEAIVRMDGSVGTSGADMIMNPTAVVISAVQSLSDGAITLPVA